MLLSQDISGPITTAILKIFMGQATAKEEVAFQQPAFPYRQLVDTDVRLLKIHSAKANDTIECSLHQLHLGSAPEYYALSYVWGDVRNRMQIILNGHPFQVTENLHSALLRLGSDEKFSGSYFWIDAICINQSDVDEKSKQVPRMTEVYSSTKLVVAWLGHNSPVDKDMIRHLFFKAALFGQQVEREGIRSRNDVSAWNQHHPEFWEDFETLIAALAWVQRRAWFSRMWVLQEAILCDRSCRLYAGIHEVMIGDLYTLTVALYDAKKNQTSIMSHLLDHAPLITMMSARQQFLEVRSAISAAGPRAAGMVAELLMDLLAATTQAKYTLDHDRIYGLCGLLGSAAGGDIISSLTPDYRLPVERIYHQYTIFIVKNTGNLRLLSCTNVKLLGVPSWVPDLRYLSLVGSRNPSPTSLRTEAVPIVSTSGLELGLDGVQIDCCEMCIESNFGYNAAELEKRVSLLEDEVIRISSSRQQVPHEEGRRRFLEGVANATGIQLSTVHSIYEAQSDLSGLSFSQSEETRVKDLICSQLFMTESGLLGWVIRMDIKIEMGDLICAVKGSYLPLILRADSRGEKYQLISACWIFDKRLELDSQYFVASRVKSFTLF
jgi:hypothetical protein